MQLLSAESWESSYSFSPLPTMSNQFLSVILIPFPKFVSNKSYINIPIALDGPCVPWFHLDFSSYLLYGFLQFFVLFLVYLLPNLRHRPYPIISYLSLG